MLQEFRKTKGWTQERFAQELGVGRSNYSRYETGRMVPPFPIAVKISKISAGAVPVSFFYPEAAEAS